MPGTRRILTCDGGGMRAIITLRCLERFEQHVGKPCYEYFDMFAGTSGGAEVIGLLALGKPVSEVVKILYGRRGDMFDRDWTWPLAPKYRKRPIHLLFKEIYGEHTRLSDLQRDVMIAAMDTVRSETTFFTSFRLPNGAGRHGTYRHVRLRDAVEASMSAPTFYRPHGRFVDGGVGSYNNAAYAAAVEALRYSCDRLADPVQRSAYDDAQLEVFSFCAGPSMDAMAAGEAMDKGFLGWMSYMISQGINQAGYQQSYVAQSELDFAESAVTFNRYDVYLTDAVIQQAAPGTSVSARELGIDVHDDERFGLLDTIGKFYADFLGRNAFFMAPATSSPVSAQAQAAVVRNARTSTRWNRYGRSQMPADYVQQVMAEFDAVDRELD
jgi:hypothetical protein